MQWEKSKIGLMIAGATSSIQTLQIQCSNWKVYLTYNLTPKIMLSHLRKLNTKIEYCWVTLRTHNHLILWTFFQLHIKLLSLLLIPSRKNMIGKFVNLSWYCKNMWHMWTRESDSSGTHCHTVKFHLISQNNKYLNKPKRGPLTASA